MFGVADALQGICPALDLQTQTSTSRPFRFSVKHPDVTASSFTIVTLVHIYVTFSTEA